MFDGPAWLVSQFYSLTNSYGFAISLVAVTVMILVLPLTLKSTKGMLEMQRLQPEMKRLQAQHRGDRQKLNEEMMKLYQEHKVNPLASCLPLLLQMPVFFIMYRVLHGLTKTKTCSVVTDFCSQADITAGKKFFDPGYISHGSALYKALYGQTEMLWLGLDLSKKPSDFIGEFGLKGLVYAGLVVLLGGLYFVQQKMVASRTVSPTMSATQAKIMQYLPVAFAVFQVFFLTGLVIYYIAQALFRIGQNAYITRRFYHGEESLGKQAQAAGERARDEAKANGDKNGGKVEGGMFAQAKRDAQARRDAVEARSNSGRGGRPGGSGRVTAPSTKPDSKSATKPAKPAPAAKSTKETTPAATPPVSSKRVTPPKNRPTPSNNRPQRPTASGRSGPPERPQPPKK